LTDLSEELSASIIMVAIIIALVMKAVSTSETFYNFCEITRLTIPESCHIRHRENLKFHRVFILPVFSDRTVDIPIKTR
jgi:hypothetical protein